MEWYHWVLVAHLSTEVGCMIWRRWRGRNDNPWLGGNGCNYINWLVGDDVRDKCCTPHDKAYKEGGWYIARWKADIIFMYHLFRHGWPWGIVLGPTLFLWVRLGGMFSFQYGKKRYVEYPSESE